MPEGLEGRLGLVVVGLPLVTPSRLADVGLPLVTPSRLADVGLPLVTPSRLADVGLPLVTPSRLADVGLSPIIRELVPLFLEYVFLVVPDVLPAAARKRDLDDEMAFTAVFLLPALETDDLLPLL